MSPAPHTLIFVDGENIPLADVSLLEGRSAHLTLLLGKNQTKLDVKLVTQIKRFHAQVELVTLAHSGRNALDLTLAYYLGQAAARHPTAELVVVSKDKDFAPLLAHLTATGIEATRHESLADIPLLNARGRPSPATPPVTVTPLVSKPSRKTGSPAKTPSPTPKPDRAARIIARLRNSKKNRPAKLASLRAHIETSLGKEASDEAIRALIEKLSRDGVLRIQTDETIVYQA